MLGVSARTDALDLGSLSLAAGEGCRLDLEARIDQFELGGERYLPQPAVVEVVLDVSRMTGHGYALRLRFEAALVGPCMRCLEEATPSISVDVREVDQPGSGEELDSPYVQGGVLDLAGWAHDALALSAPDQLLCREDCAGLCPQCAANLNEAGPGHVHERTADPRWAKLGELRLD